MSAFQIFGALVTLAALAAYLNHRILRLPTSIGLMLCALALSAVLLALREAGLIRVDDARALVESLDFGQLVLHGLLAFLLFAGALHVDLAQLRSQAWAVGLLATLGVAVSAAVTGALFWLAARALGLELAFMHALLFGALISPTDPIAVLAILRRAGVTQELEMQISGESLFNDGVAVVLFVTLAHLAFGGESSISGTAFFLAQEVAGGLLAGAAVGLCADRLLQGVDDYSVEVLLTLAAAMGGYGGAELLGVSAPITVVVAGLLIGSHSRQHAMSEKTREHLDTFWELVDYVLNALLFVVLGLELLALESALTPGAALALAAAAVPLALAARLAGVSVALGVLRPAQAFRRGSVAMLTWGGLKGGISLALALSLPQFPGREILLAATYAVVVFSVTAQGLTLGRLAARYAGSAPP